MQVTIDIPEALYAELEFKASATKTSLEMLVLNGASRILQDELVADARPATATALSMDLNLNDFALMTDSEIAAFEEQFARETTSAIRDFGVRRLGDGG